MALQVEPCGESHASSTIPKPAKLTGNKKLDLPCPGLRRSEDGSIVKTLGKGVAGGVFCKASQANQEVLQAM